MWSVYHSIILKDPRTNNVSEASNNAFIIAAAASHLAMPKYKHLQLFNAEGETEELQDLEQKITTKEYLTTSEHTTAITLLSG